MPAVFTIGPHDDKFSLEKYAVLLTGDADGGQAATAKAKTVGTGRNHVQDIVKGIIEGETRSIVSNMTMEELFNNRRLFKAQVSSSDHFSNPSMNAPILTQSPGHRMCPEGA